MSSASRRSRASIPPTWSTSSTPSCRRSTSRASRSPTAPRSCGPASLRGLDSHHTLVLVNGRRRHRAALVQLGGFGSHGPDIGNFPSIALQSVEVLRDGAAAQYGSDAIAGVVNFNLKSADSGLRSRHAGSAAIRKATGMNSPLKPTRAFRSADGGFINVSGQLSDTGQTNRSEPYDISIGRSGPDPARSHAQPAHGRRRHILRSGRPHLHVRAGRGPLSRSCPAATVSPDDLDTPLRGQLPPCRRARAPSKAPRRSGGQPRREQALFVVNRRAARSLPPLNSTATATTRRPRPGRRLFSTAARVVSQLLPLRLEDGSIYDPRTSLYPSGFTPFFSGVATDYSGAIGLRGESARGLTNDVSVELRQPRVALPAREHAEPFARTGDTDGISPGQSRQRRTGDQCRFSRGRSMWAVRVRSTLRSVSNSGRKATRSRRGDAASSAHRAVRGARPVQLRDHPGRGRRRPGRQPDRHRVPDPGAGKPSARCVRPAIPSTTWSRSVSNGFPGYSAQFTSDVKRDSYAGYLDLELDVTDDWLASTPQPAWRAFRTSADVAIGKLAMRYSVTGRLNLRGSAGTGFRAPTPGPDLDDQRFPHASTSRAFPVAEGVFPAESIRPAGLFGRAGRSTQRTRAPSRSGWRAEPADGLSLTLDYYRVDLDDRIILSSQFAVGPGRGAAARGPGPFPAQTPSPRCGFSPMTWTRRRAASISLPPGAGDWFSGGTTLQAAVNRNTTKLTERGPLRQRGGRARCAVRGRRTRAPSCRCGSPGIDRDVTRPRQLFRGLRKCQHG